MVDAEVGAVDADRVRLPRDLYGVLQGLLRAWALLPGNMRRGQPARQLLARPAQLGFERRFSYATSLSQLCAQDIITVLYASPPMRGASCAMVGYS